MQYRKLGHTDLDVSLICLGTMTWGEQNTEKEAHDQLDYAVDQGINFIDTAEMYPIPVSAETQGRTESYIGTWLDTRPRDEVILATKISGPGVSYLRDYPYRLDRRHIREGLEGSLRRLKTDYVDLYQVHWPDRRTNMFGRLGYTPQDDGDAVPIEETLGALSELVDEGKVRYVGVSNETPWGVMRYLRAAEREGLSQIVSIQNPYHLLNRTFEIGLAEMAHREGTGLLAYSPIAMGVLSGKYLGGAKPEGARLTLYSQLQRYTQPGLDEIVGKYVALAERHGLDPAQMALAFVNSRPFVTSTIIGATTMDQLKSDIASLDVSLSDPVLDGIEEIHDMRPNPCP